MRRRALVASLLAGLSLHCGCVSAKRPASGTFMGQRIETTLDAPEAAYYLTSYLAGLRHHPMIDEKIDRLHATASPERLPTREELMDVAQRFSTDFAALFFADRVGRDPRNARVHAMFVRYLERPDESATELVRGYARHVVLFAPGWDYVSNGPVTGADFAQPRRLISELGIENHFIAFDPQGAVEANAEEIVQAIERASASGKEVIVVSASSAGPAVHVALDAMNTGGRLAPAAWINLGGILHGSPLVERIKRFPWSVVFRTYAWVKGWDAAAVDSMSAARGRARFPRLAIPRKTLVLNYVGLSLSGSLSKFAKDKHAMLRNEGPNDGLTPIADIVAPRGVTLIAPTSDHFFAEDPLINRKTVALAKTVITLLDEPATKTIGVVAGDVSRADSNVTVGR